MKPSEADGTVSVSHLPDTERGAGVPAKVSAVPAWGDFLHVNGYMLGF